MKIHCLKLENVRNIRRLRLDLSAPCTVVSGRVGTCKSTVQQAALTALFRTTKRDRESLVSKFDPHAAPTAVLELAQGQDVPTITVSRTLLHDQGTWTENGTTLRAKGKALDKIQELLPISSNAAAMLLWGQQERLSDVLFEFPSDGHSLLTAATVRGSGPNPKDVVAQLEERFRQSKRKGKSPGALTKAAEAVARLEDELETAIQAEQDLRELRRAYDQSKVKQQELSAAREACESLVVTFRKSKRALTTSLDINQELRGLLVARSEWNQLDDRLSKAKHASTSLADELKTIQSQFRVARDAEFAAEISKVQAQIAVAATASEKVENLDRQLNSTRRPCDDDLERLWQIVAEISDARSRLEANGLRYRISVATDPQSVEVVEDDATATVFEVTPDRPHESIVGKVLVRGENVTFMASGKEDVASLKRLKARAEEARRRLLATFGTTDEDGFRVLADERMRLESELADRRNDLVCVLKGSTPEELQMRSTQLEQARVKNGMTAADQELVGERFLPGSAEIEKRMFRKEAELNAALEDCKRQERERPTDAERAEVESRIVTLRARSVAAAAVYEHGDEHVPEPSVELLGELEDQLSAKESELESLTNELHRVDRQLAGLVADLKHTGPSRSPNAAQAELEDARELLQREEMLQAACELLMSRIQETADEMAAEVPAEIGARISQHLTELSAGVFGGVKLSDKLSLQSVLQDGEHPVVWELHELSTGERTLAALTLRIAVALSLAEMVGPIFVMLDDSLVNLDAEYRFATEHLLSELVANGRLQVILFTCHTDWARQWRASASDDIAFIDIENECEYFHTPASLAATA